VECKAGYIYGPSHVGRFNPRRALLEVSVDLRGKVWMEGSKTGYFMDGQGYVQTTAAHFRMIWLEDPSQPMQGGGFWDGVRKNRDFVPIIWYLVVSMETKEWKEATSLFLSDSM
jgi:hypothetical protein